MANSFEGGTFKEGLVYAESFTQLTKIILYSESSQVLDRGENEIGAGGN
jgi:hypothetical protein